MTYIISSRLKKISLVQNMTHFFLQFDDIDHIPEYVIAGHVIYHFSLQLKMVVTSFKILVINHARVELEIVLLTIVDKPGDFCKTILLIPNCISNTFFQIG